MLLAALSGIDTNNDRQNNINYHARTQPGKMMRVNTAPARNPRSHLVTSSGQAFHIHNRTKNTQMKTPLTIALTCCFMAALGPFISAGQKQPKTATAAEPAGVYALVSVNGKPVPASLDHEGATLQVRSGAFTINADGTCGSKMVFVPPSGTEVTREVGATYTRAGSKLTMKWKGAGMTTGTIEGSTFTMENEGMLLVYKK